MSISPKVFIAVKKWSEESSQIAVPMEFSGTSTVTNSAKKTEPISLLGIERAQRTPPQPGNMVGHET